MTVKILWDDSVAAYRVATPYNPSFVETLKKLIPASDRVWDPVTKIWTVAEGFALPIKQLCESIYGKGSVTFVSKQDAAKINAQRAAAQAQAQAAFQQTYQYVPPPAAKRGEPIDVCLLNFVKALPYEAARAAYRKAAMELHPDANGGVDDPRMTLLNTTWQRIEKEFYAK